MCKGEKLKTQNLCGFTLFRSLSEIPKKNFLISIYLINFSATQSWHFQILNLFFSKIFTPFYLKLILIAFLERSQNCESFLKIWRETLFSLESYLCPKFSGCTPRSCELVVNMFKKTWFSENSKKNPRGSNIFERFPRGQISISFPCETL